MIEPIIAHIYNVDFIDPLSRRIVYAMTIDAQPHEPKGTTFNRACAWAERRGVNVKACTHRMVVVL